METAYAAGGAGGGACFMAEAVSVRRLSTTNKSLHSHRPAFPCFSSRSLPPPLSTSASASASFIHFSASNRLALFQIKASSSEETSGSGEVGEVFLDLKEKWDALENKSALILYGGGAIFAIWLSSVIVDSINSVPLSSRKELADEIEALKKKIAGSG
ncbi:protein CURVATURE THYLAKOID 1A, chloroplastic-like isoform X2 [Camellia sinensis]|uniref:protein CURVATURE THYLAKOID 1A, chloroplastic-like isoform X2 n=1 Tax=Camellia sinensis TaxID=4442 RepID=UPI001035E387|nr:protein CURVATURE THYLAKOID 1A, chloroplastic-like isoform X2 [Camellia sinensis]